MTHLLVLSEMVWRSWRTIVIALTLFQHTFWQWVGLCLTDGDDVTYDIFLLLAIDPSQRLDWFHENYPEKYCWAKDQFMKAVSNLKSTK